MWELSRKYADVRGQELEEGRGQGQGFSGCNFSILNMASSFPVSRAPEHYVGES